VPGCRTSCLTRCYGLVPSQYPSVAACAAYWGPRSLAVREAVRNARMRAISHTQ
jgi:hypothetical protein